MRRNLATYWAFSVTLACVGHVFAAGDQLYVATDSSNLYLLRNLTAGQYSLAAPGSMSIKTLDVEADTTGVVPGGFTLANVHTTANALSAGGQVLLGTTNGHVLSYDANLLSLKTDNDICNGCGQPVQALAVGQFGDLPVAVAAAHTLDAPLGTGGFDVVSFNANMEFIGNQGFYDDGTGPDPDVTALRFGNLDATRAGNELFIGTTNLNTIHKNSGFLGGVAKDPAATAANPLPMSFVWDTADGDVSNGVTNPWFGMNNTIADATVADTITFVGQTDEIVVVGQTNDFTGPDHEGPHQFGTMVHQYLATSPAGPTFVFENGGAAATQTEKPILAATTGNILDQDPGGNFDFSGDELIWAGIDQLRICNGTTFCRPYISTGERIQKVALADVLHGDGVLEIVVATSNAPFFVAPGSDTTGIPFTGGRILVYEHENIGDMASDFVLDPTGETPRGAIIELGETISVTGLAALAETTPPAGVPGDYNSDGTVNAADYTIWRDTLGSTTDLRANGDNSGASANLVDNADYVLWKNHFGESNSGVGSLGAGAVPEPSSCCVVCAAMIVLAPCIHRRSAGRSK